MWICQEVLPTKLAVSPAMTGTRGRRRLISATTDAINSHDRCHSVLNSFRYGILLTWRATKSALWRLTMRTFCHDYPCSRPDTGKFVDTKATGGKFSNIYNGFRMQKSTESTSFKNANQSTVTLEKGG
jgi:hypothetical protein